MDSPSNYCWSDRSLPPSTSTRRPLLSNATPVPPNFNFHHQWQSAPQVWDPTEGLSTTVPINHPQSTSNSYKEIRNPDNNFEAPQQWRKVAEYYESKTYDYLFHSEHKLLAEAATRQSLFAWYSRAQILLSKDETIGTLRRITSMDFDHLWANLATLRSSYVFHYVVWLDRINAYEKILMELNAREPVSGSIIEKVFHGGEMAIQDMGLVEGFRQRKSSSFLGYPRPEGFIYLLQKISVYLKWARKFSETKYFASTLSQSYHIISYSPRLPQTKTNQPFLRAVRAFWQNPLITIDQINLKADQVEATARRGQSEMHMTESLLLRYIRVTKESKPGQALLKMEMERLNGLQVEASKTKEWIKLMGLVNWLRFEYMTLHK
ncbi:hypothetical protein H0H93_016774 [Arthromyces matolae]|nr:hypothetical protein H0H93_016774 [Arthromyces matolae]